MGDASSAIGGAGLSLASIGLAPFTAGTSLAFLPTALSVGAAGAGAAGSILKGIGTSSADTFRAEELQREAEFKGLEATQTNAQMIRNLGITLGNIDAVRAASHDNPTSPTGAAVRDYTEMVGTEQKNIKVDSILAQAREDEASAAYLRSASTTALLSGGIDAGAGILKGISGLPPGGSLGNSSIGNPTQIGALY
jgi:hypothetical protein